MVLTKDKIETNKQPRKYQFKSIENIPSVHQPKESWYILIFLRLYISDQ